MPEISGNNPYMPSSPVPVPGHPTTPPSPAREAGRLITSQNILAKLVALWNKDVSYKILYLAVALVVIASLVFIALGANALASSNTSGPIWASSQVEHPPTPTPVGTVDHVPGFATPVTGTGSHQSSQPDTTGSSTYLAPTPTPAATQPASGPLTVQILNIPNTVNNNSRVRVDVQTSEPDVTVSLQITYDTVPFFASSGSKTTNGSGNATLTWTAKVVNLQGNGAQASVVVVATDQNGQQARSQAATVTIA